MEHLEFVLFMNHMKHNIVLLYLIDLNIFKEVYYQKKICYL